MAGRRTAIRALLRRLGASGRRRASQFRSRPNPDSVIVLGNQKSGTSAIAGLLAAATDQTATIDFPGEITNLRYVDVLQGRMDARAFLWRYRHEFSRDIVKEPSLTWIAREVFRELPHAKGVLVVRDPAQNLRSLLDRLDLPGDAPGLTEERLARLSRAWRRNIDCRWMGCAGESYVEWMSHRWVRAAALALDPVLGLTVIRYEDFMADKVGCLRTTASSLGLDFRPDRLVDTNHAFQPRGSHRGVSPHIFFGEENLAKIRRITGPVAQQLGYT